MGVWLLLGLVGCGLWGAPSGPEVATPAVDAKAEALAIAARIEAEVDCERSFARYLCGARRVDGEPFEPPTAGRTWVGMTVAVRRSRALEDGAQETVGLAQLTVDGAGAWVTSMRPSSELESLAMGRVLSNASLAAKGAAEDIEVPQDLLDYLAGGGGGTTRWPLTRDGAGWAFTGRHAGRLFRAPAEAGRPAALVVVEASDYGAFLSIFPDVPLRAVAVGGPPAEDMPEATFTPAPGEAPVGAPP